MIQFPNAKINLGLQITAKLPDGFHELTSIFYPVGWADALEIIIAEEFQLTLSGIVYDGDAANNLCTKVFKALQQEYNLPHVHIHLHKNIPVGAGLGGGSSDAAFALKMLNQLFDLKLDNHAMQEWIKPFGSDCAFFVDNMPAMAPNKGESLRKIDFSLAGKYIVLVYPNLFISTKEAYSQVVPCKSNISLEDYISLPLSDWKDTVLNDFEKSLFPSYPLLSTVKQHLYDLGASYASMSGSGSTMYGIFDNDPNIKDIFPSNYLIWKEILK